MLTQLFVSKLLLITYYLGHCRKNTCLGFALDVCLPTSGLTASHQHLSAHVISLLLMNWHDQQCPQHTSIKETKEATMYSQWPKIHKYFIYWTVIYITWSRYYANIISTALCRTGWKAVKEEQRSFTTDWPSMQQAAVRKVTTLKLLTMQLLQSLSTTEWLWQPWLSQTDYRLQGGMLNCTMTGRRGVLIHHILS